MGSSGRNSSLRPTRRLRGGGKAARSLFRRTGTRGAALSGDNAGAQRLMPERLELAAAPAVRFAAANARAPDPVTSGAVSPFNTASTSCAEWPP